jgi:hypothetical protein
MPSAGLEPAVPANERPQTYTLDRAATGIDTREWTISDDSANGSFAFGEEVRLTSYWRQ